MPTNIKDYSTTQASNTSLNGISSREGMLPSNLNNALRALMKNTRDWYNEAEWIEYGDGTGAYTSSYASAYIIYNCRCRRNKYLSCKQKN